MYENLTSITNESDVYLFTYGIIAEDQDTNFNNSKLKEMACNNSGIAFFITEGTKDKVVEVMREYYVFLSNGITIEEPIWTEPYVDAFIEEDIISVIFPIYFQEENSTIRNLLGVASLDISMEYLGQFGVTNENAIEKFISNIPCQ